MPIMSCPNHPEHKIFVTMVMTCQMWAVNENGEWLETLDDCIDYIPPSAKSVWECVECGAEAEEYRLRLVTDNEEKEK